MKRIILLIGVLCLQACSTTDPGTAADIAYRLPRTDVKVTLTIDVSKCLPDVEVTSTLTPAAVPGVRDGYLHVSGKELSSNVTKRNLTIDVYDTGVISGINAASTDETTAILGNVIKIGATVAAAALEENQIQNLTNVNVSCTKQTIQNLARLKEFQSLLASALAKEPPPNKQLDNEKHIEALASAVVAAQATLHREVSATANLEKLTLDGKETVDVPFETGPLGELFDVSSAQTGGTTGDVAAGFASLFQVVVSGVAAPAATDGLTGGSSSPTGPCRAYITVPVAKPATLTVKPTGRLLNDGKKHSQSLPVYVSQPKNDGTLCISAGFGENRAMGLKFDRYGQTTDFSWTADARAANITSMLAGSASDASTIATKIAPSDLTREKAELDKLTTENNLQLGRVCQAILAAGGTSCK